MNEEMVKAALEAIEAGDTDAAMQLLKDALTAAAAGADAMPSTEGADAEALTDAPDPEPENEEEMALSRSVLVALGRDKVDGAAAEAERLIKLGLDYEKHRGEMELSKRRDLVAKLIELGYETPASAWEGDAEKRNPAKHLRAESIEELSARVDRMAEAKKAPPAPPKTSGKDGFELNENEKRLSKNMTPEQLERYTESRRRARGGKS